MQHQRLPERGDYQLIDPDDAYNPGTPDYLFQSGDVTPGWVLQLAENEKVTTDPFAFSGIISFTAYNPLLVVNADETCGQTGFSRIFVVKATNANPYIFPTRTTPASAAATRSSAISPPSRSSSRA